MILTFSWVRSGGALGAPPGSPLVAVFTFGGGPGFVWVVSGVLVVLLVVLLMLLGGLPLSDV